MHSGRQPGGDPKKPIWHEQIGRPPITRQMLFGPHGDGSQRFVGGSSVYSKFLIRFYKDLVVSLCSYYLYEYWMELTDECMSYNPHSLIICWNF